MFTAHSNDVKKSIFDSKYILLLVRLDLKIWLKFRNARATILMKWHKFICHVRIWFPLTCSERDFSLWNVLLRPLKKILTLKKMLSKKEREKRNPSCLNVGILLGGRQGCPFLSWRQYNFWKLCLSHSIKYKCNACYVLKCGTYQDRRVNEDFSLL